MKKYNFTSTQDWIKYFQVIVAESPTTALLELGLGDGTEFFLDNYKHVISLELSLGSYNKGWFDKCLNKYKDYTNWTPIYVDLPSSVHESNRLAVSNRHPINYDKHIIDLKNILTPVFNDNQFDTIFVDAGIHNRGELVNLCFNQANIIVAHDTSRDPNRILKNIYGYNIVEVPNDYTEIHFEDTYMGTTVWVKKDLENLVNKLNNII